jgi:hypothetical protein
MRSRSRPAAVFHPFAEIAKGTLKVLQHSLDHDADETTLKDIRKRLALPPAASVLSPASCFFSAGDSQGLDAVTA